MCFFKFLKSEFWVENLISRGFYLKSTQIINYLSTQFLVETYFFWDLILI